jgi:type VI secretion system protein ImpE
MTARDAILNGDVDQALAELFQEVRAQPDQARHRVFLFQLLSVAGQWDRALTQLNVARDLDPSTGVMAQAYQEILQCEALRRQVFAGTMTPLVFGDPEPWLAQLIEALRLDGQGNAQAANQLRRQAIEAVPANPGTLRVAHPDRTPSGDKRDSKEESVGEAVGEEVPFQWLADGDSRLGPVLEMIVNGRYYWAPLGRIESIQLDPPADLRDVVWTPAHFRWSNGGEAVGVIPTRYVGSESQPDNALRLARLTRWEPLGEDAYQGLGQRVFMSDQGDYGLMDIRRITFAAAAPDGD